MEFSISRVISGTFGTLKDRFGSLIGIYLLYFVITIVASTAFFALVGTAFMGAGMASGGMTDPSAMMSGLGAGAILAVVLFYVFYILLILAQLASMTHMASPLHQPQFGQSMAAGWRSSLTMLGIFVVLFIGYIICALVFGLLGAALSTLGNGGMVVFGIVVLVALVYVSCRLSVMFAVVAVEGQRNPLTAITRSWRLTSGRVVPIFFVTLLFILIMGLAFAAAFAPIMSTVMAGAMGGAPAVEPAIGSIMASGLLFLVLIVLIALLQASFMANLHAALSGTTGEDLSSTFG